MASENHTVDGVLFDGLRKFVKPIRTWIVSNVLYILVWLLGLTIRWESRREQNYVDLIQSGKTPILVYWHDRIFLSSYYLRNKGVTALTSMSQDGEYLARLLRKLGFRLVRGSSSLGGSAALSEMAHEMKSGNAIAMNPDGPRGPRYEAKIGAVILAKRTGNPILPFVVECKRFWSLNSWDHFQVPRPFTRATAIFGEPIYVNLEGDGKLDEKLNELQSSLDELVRRGERWRDG